MQSPKMTAGATPFSARTLRPPIVRRSRRGRSWARFHTQEAHDQAEIVAGDVDQVALLHLLPAAQPHPAHAAAAEGQREAAFHQLGAQLERLPCNSPASPTADLAADPALSHTRQRHSCPTESSQGEFVNGLLRRELGLDTSEDTAAE